MTSIRLHAAAGHYAEIGQMIVSFQSLEASIKHFLLLLIARQQPTESVLTRKVLNELPFAALLRIVESFPAIFDRPWLDAMPWPQTKTSLKCHATALDNISAGIKLARSVENRRNVLIHSEWISMQGIPAAPGAILRSKMSKGGNPKILNVNEETIESIAQVAKDAKMANDLFTTGFRAILSLGLEASTQAGAGAA